MAGSADIERDEGEAVSASREGVVRPEGAAAEPHMLDSSEEVGSW